MAKPTTNLALTVEEQKALDVATVIRALKAQAAGLTPASTAQWQLHPLTPGGALPPRVPNIPANIGGRQYPADTSGLWSVFAEPLSLTRHAPRSEGERQASVQLRPDGTVRSVDGFDLSYDSQVTIWHHAPSLLILHIAPLDRTAAMFYVMQIQVELTTDDNHTTINGAWMTQFPATCVAASVGMMHTERTDRLNIQRAGAGLSELPYRPVSADQPDAVAEEDAWEQALAASRKQKSKE